MAQIANSKPIIEDYDNYIKADDKCEDLFIYGFGLSGKWLSDNIDKKVTAFIDTDIKKVGRSYNGINVISIDDAAKLLKINSEIIVTVVDIQDVIPILESFPNNKWSSLGLKLNNTKATNNLTGEKDSFIEYSLKAVENCHKSFFDKNKLYMRSIDLVITERCSLKCKDCANLMQYFHSPINISYEEIIHDLKNLLKNVDYIHEIRLIGGEPFMNKNIYKIIEHISNFPKIAKIVVYTNATIPIKETNYEIKILKNPKVVFCVTDYGSLSKNTRKVVSTLDKFNIAYRLHLPENWTDSGTIFDYKRSVPELEDLFDKCCGKNLLTLTGGKIYRCPFAASADRLEAVPKDERNGVNINSNSRDIKRYISEIKYLPACNYCKGRSWDAEEVVPAIQVRKPINYKKFD